VPDGRTPPVKSAALAGLPPLPVTAQLAEEAPVVRPDRATVKVNAVLPALPSALLAWSALMASAVSSLVMVDDAVGCVMVAPLGLERVTVKPSSSLTAVSP